MPESFLDTAIPIVLILIVLGFLWSKLNKPFIKLFEWLKENLKSKKHKEPKSNTYSYIDYE